MSDTYCETCNKLLPAHADADPVYFLYLWTSPEFEAETRGLAESQALRWLASELHFTGRT